MTEVMKMANLCRSDVAIWQFERWIALPREYFGGACVDRKQGLNRRSTCLDLPAPRVTPHQSTPGFSFGLCPSERVSIRGCHRPHSRKTDSRTRIGILRRGATPLTVQGGFNSRAWGRLKAARRDTAQVTPISYFTVSGVGGGFAVTLRRHRVFG